MNRTKNEFSDQYIIETTVHSMDIDQNHSNQRTQALKGKLLGLRNQYNAKKRKLDQYKEDINKYIFDVNEKDTLIKQLKESIVLHVKYIEKVESEQDIV